MATKKEKSPEQLLEKLKQKAKEQLAIDRHHLLMKMPFIGSLLMRLDLVPVRDERLSTAATNGDKVFVDIDFYGTLTKEERLFVLAHEAWHCALLHFMRRQNRNHEKFNYAADLEIHFILTGDGLKAPFVLPHSPSWKGLSAEEIYARLESPSLQLSGGAESENIKNVRGGGGFDTHLENGQSLDAEDPTGGNASKGTGSAEQAGGNAPGGTGKGIDSDFSPEIAAGAAERCRERLTATVQQFQRMKGDMPLGIESVVEKILEPKINWRELLSQFVTSCYGGSRQWLPPNRRHVWRGLYMQSSRDTRLNAVVAVDTSGSTTGDLPRFFSELGGLLNSFGSYQLTVIQCDAKVQKTEVFDDMTPFPPDYKWEAKGGGGTDFRPVFHYVEKHSEIMPSLLIYLTDGYGDYPEHAPAYPVLWMVAPQGKISVSWGLQCPFDEEKE